MKQDSVQLQVVKIAVGSAVLSLICAVVFIVIGKFDISVLLGLIIGFVMSVGNFILMSLGVVKALETGDELTARRKLRTSYLIRIIGMAVIMAMSLIVDFINPIPVLLSVFYVRITIFVLGFFEKKKSMDEVVASTEPDGHSEIEEPEEEQKEDEFEKFVGSFYKEPKQKKNKEDNDNGDPDADTVGNQPDRK